ncbi:helix-turn-helix domain-containing protein [Advenella mimigardefordensis]|uniref:Putative transcriptional regulator n=1 Tax=Advenella mimigardefordensis (strain DSM 17166 / LMG 22922 / DPN7) TaxID=1247726 RepID=W0PE49_ADVMD|nr:helix-turn-helix transcriptional regulator [Advenella mimigardefordensis]AHG65159.1 putative transcriptional regulator [Advenella mimigardefordensis DPN7]
MPKKSSKETTPRIDRGADKPQKRTRSASGQVVKVATLKELRKATGHTQEDLAIALDIGQGTISRIEKRSDMLVSTLQHYIESLGGTLQIVAAFTDRPSIVVERLGKKIPPHQKNTSMSSSQVMTSVDT